MAPIHDTDVAEERWQSASWRNFELWERIELRLKRRRVLLILLTLLTFLVLSSVPIVVERGPKWRGVVVTRRIAQEITQVKRDSATLRMAMQLIIDPVSGEFRVRQLTQCSAAQISAPLVDDGIIRHGNFFTPGSLRLLTPEDAGKFGLGELITSFCYDPHSGSQGGDSSALKDRGFAVIPEQDFAAGRSDRVSAIVIRNISADLTFD